MRLFNEGDRIEIANCILDNVGWNGRKGMVAQVMHNPFCPHHNLYLVEMDEDIPNNPHVLGRRSDGTPIDSMPANQLRLFHFQLVHVATDWNI